jgi:hypothetical protein
MKTRRAQAAMEFLMTYGWAILVVLVAIGALAYFGVLSPDKFLPAQTTGPSGLDAIDKAALTTVSMGIGSKNNLGYSIRVDEQPVELKYEDGTTDVCTAADGGISKVIISGSNIKYYDSGDNLLATQPTELDLTGSTGNYAKISNGDAFNIVATCTDTTGDGELKTGRFKGSFKFTYQNIDTGIPHPAVYSITGRVS